MYFLDVNVTSIIDFLIPGVFDEVPRVFSSQFYDDGSYFE